MLRKGVDTGRVAPMSKTKAFLQIGNAVPPIMARQVNAIGTRIATELDEQGKPGAVSQLETYDAWYPGYIDYMPMYQNINAWWTETQCGNCAVPRTSTVADLPPDYK